jgi:hypothetical protein
VSSPQIDLSFPHRWRAEILPARPVILPARHFTYPSEAEEVERGALEVLIRPNSADASEPSPCAEQFLATCALGFRDPLVPTGLWSTPDPDQICAVSGGYAYLIDTTAPQRFAMLPYRPVLQVRPVPEQNLLLFVGHHAILARGASGEAWQSSKLSDEGVTISSIDAGLLHGIGWNLITDKETPFTIDLESGSKVLSNR